MAAEYLCLNNFNYTNIMKRFTTLTSIAFIVMTSTAQTLSQPQFVTPVPGEKSVVLKISNNGQWGVRQFNSKTDGTIAPSGGMIVNISDPSRNIDISHSSGISGVSDITDDGSIVVGECLGKPAYWSSTSKTWTSLPLPGGYTLGRLSAVTPDGHYAVGAINRVDEWDFDPVLYDLTTGQFVELPNIPNKDMSGVSQGQNMFLEISADGRYILGQISQSYPSDMCSYVYDTQTKTYKHIGFKEETSGKLTPLHPNLIAVECSSAMSNNGKYVGGMAYYNKEIPGNEFGAESLVSYIYDIENDKFTLHAEDEDLDIGAFSVTNNGTLLAATPPMNPAATFMVRHGKHFYSFDQILKQVYGITDFEGKTGISTTGKPCSVSDDGLTLAMLYSTDASYILRLSEPLEESCGKVNLLSEYAASPASGSIFSSLKSASVIFSRPIATNGLTSSVKIYNSAGKSIANALRADVEGTKVTFSFMTVNIPAGETYTIKIPKGFITIAGDKSMSADEITLSYTGRKAGAVAVTSAYPVNGAAVALLDASSNPITLQFDADIAVADGKQGLLFRNDEKDPIATLSLLSYGRVAMVYPPSGQRLFKDTRYRVVIPQGAFTDISGAGASDEISLEYTGTYVREVVGDSKYIFNESCNSIENFMLYDGDRNTPNSVSSSWDFTEAIPWWPVRDSNESTDFALASHSMYSPAGKSDDWCSTPQLLIPDENCVLTFDSQSYLKDGIDRLKVMVLATDDLYGELTAERVARFRKEGDVILNEIQSPGESEDLLEGDWRHNVISLAKYAGKNIYIAFINENEDESAIFIDNIQVLRDVKYGILFDTPLSVVQKESVPVSGTIAITSETDSYPSAELSLLDGDGNTLDTFRHDSPLKNGDNFQFAFPTPLPLTPGTITNYTVVLRLGENRFNINRSIRNMMFEPVQRVVLEEYTGAGCGNCPQGIVAIENLEKIYQDRFIPLTLRCYGGDQLGAGLSPYSSFLGMSAAPSGRINRGEITSPMIVVDEDFRFSGEGITMPDGSDSGVWLDHVKREMEKGTSYQINVQTNYDPAANTVTATCTVRAALNLENQNLAIFGVISEDNLTTYQSNYHATSTDPDFGPWGKGGEYGQATVYPYTTRDVVRGAYGNTFNGTGGLLPLNLEAGKEYVAEIGGAIPPSVKDVNNTRFTAMIIDTNTGRVVNAHRVKVVGDDSGANVSEISTVTLERHGETLAVGGTGLVEVTLYSAEGVLLQKLSARESVTVTLPAGISIVRISDANGNRIVKLNN